MLKRLAQSERRLNVARDELRRTAYTLRVSFRDRMKERLSLLDAKSLRRHERTHPRSLISFSSNDYLGLANSPAIAKAWNTADEVGSGASRLVCGTRAEHLAVEHALASFVDHEDAALFSSGFAANVGVLPALATSGVIYSARLNHASLIDGARLSRARVVIYDDLAELEEQLANEDAALEKWIVTEAIFSMDGNAADLLRLRALADRYGAALVVDEAHALGVLGGEGRGLCRALGVRADVLIGTLGKSFGVSGAFVAGCEEVVAWLKNRARSYVFSTALPAAQARAILVALDEVKNAHAARSSALASAKQIAAELAALGYVVPRPDAAIVSVIIGDPERTLALSSALRELGFLVGAIRPPTVPRGTSRLRIVCSVHEADVVTSLLTAFRDLAPQHLSRS